MAERVVNFLLSSIPEISILILPFPTCSPHYTISSKSFCILENLRTYLLQTTAIHIAISRSSKVPEMNVIKSLVHMEPRTVLQVLLGHSVPNIAVGND